jgi:hypothetical protein
MYMYMYMELDCAHGAHRIVGILCDYVYVYVYMYMQLR